MRESWNQHLSTTVPTAPFEMHIAPQNMTRPAPRWKVTPDFMFFSAPTGEPILYGTPSWSYRISCSGPHPENSQFLNRTFVEFLTRTTCPPLPSRKAMSSMSTFSAPSTTSVSFPVSFTRGTPSFVTYRTQPSRVPFSDMWIGNSALAGSMTIVLPTGTTVLQVRNFAVAVPTRTSYAVSSRRSIMEPRQFMVSDASGNSSTRSHSPPLPDSLYSRAGAVSPSLTP